MAVGLALQLVPVCVSAQELTPGEYWPLPVRVNIITFINSVNWGAVAFDPALPAEDSRGTIDTVAVAYTRTLSIAGRSANVAFQIPIAGGHVEGLYLGAPTARDAFGLTDPRLSLGVNLYGAPAMTPQAHASYRMRLLVGASLTVAPPLGQYDATKIINLGSNRWALKPEIGLSRAAGRWIVEAMVGAWLFTDNHDFSSGRTREQAPIASVQAHLTYRFGPRIWLAGDANFYKGGQTTVDGVRHLDVQRNDHRRRLHLGGRGCNYAWTRD